MTSPLLKQITSSAKELERIFFENAPFVHISDTAAFLEHLSLDIDHLLQNHNGEIYLHEIDELEKYFSRSCNSSIEAKNAYLLGTPIALKGIQESLIFARVLQEEIGQIYQVSADLFECVLFAEVQDIGLPFHWDVGEVIVIQLKGSKLWSIAPNKIAYPTKPFAPSSSQLPLPELNLYTTPESFCVPVDEVEQFVLTPGSLLYLPRGYWHKTLSVDASISLTIASIVPPLVDFFSDRIREHLIRLEKWRQPAYPATLSRLLNPE